MMIIQLCEMKAAHGGFVIIQKSCLLMRILEFLTTRWDIRIQFFLYSILYSQKLLPQLLIYVFISLRVLIYFAIELCKTKTKLSNISNLSL